MYRIHHSLYVASDISPCMSKQCEYVMLQPLNTVFSEIHKKWLFVGEDHVTLYNIFGGGVKILISYRTSPYDNCNIYIYIYPSLCPFVTTHHVGGWICCITRYLLIACVARIVAYIQQKHTDAINYAFVVCLFVCLHVCMSACFVCAVKHKQTKLRKHIAHSIRIKHIAAWV